MRKPVFEVFAALSLSVAAIVAPAAEAASSVMIMKSYARASATPTAKTSAAYVSLMNHGAADKLLSVSTPAAKSAEVHKTENVDGVMKMLPAGALDIPANGVLEMKPGGYHIMLTDVVKPLKKGDTIEVTLTFEKAGEVKVKVPVQTVAAGGMDNMKMDGMEMDGSQGSAGSGN